MSHTHSQTLGKTFRDYDKQFISFVKSFVIYCKEREQLVDDLIDNLDPDSEGKLENQILIERAGKLGIKLNEGDIVHFLECLEIDNKKVDIDKLFDEINKGMFIEDSISLRAAYF